jgi:2,3,4,5-tetrahydropyridine-2-carboxylate N-succinyltransferase
MSSLKSSIERLAAQGEVERDPEARKIFLEFRDQLTQGKIRAAEKLGDRGNASGWIVNAWVKQGILLGFPPRGELAEMPAGLVLRRQRHFPCPPVLPSPIACASFPGGSSVREGAYVAPSVICMPPMFINVGAYVDEGTHGRFARAGRLVRTDRQTRPPQRRRAGRRRARTHQRRAR